MERIPSMSRLPPPPPEPPPTYSPPVIVSLSPNSGQAAGGTVVPISGSNFRAGSTVTFGGVAATSVVFVSASQLTCVTPAGTAGVVTLTVASPGTYGSGSLVNGFIY